MKKYNLLILIVFLVIAGCDRNGPAGEGRALVQPEDTVLVEVDGKPVTVPMLEFLMEVRGVGEDNEAGMRELLDELIRIRAMANEAEASGLAGEKRVRAERAIKDMELLYLRYTERYQQDNPLEEADLREVYDSQLERAGDTQYRLELVTFDHQEAAGRAAARVNRGEADFSDLEGDSQLASPGWVDRSQVPETFGAELAGAGAGDVLPLPLEIRDSWSVVRVAETRPLEQPAFEEVKEGIARGLNRQRVQELIDQTYEAAEITPMLPLDEAK